MDLLNELRAGNDLKIKLKLTGLDFCILQAAGHNEFLASDDYPFGPSSNESIADSIGITYTDFEQRVKSLLARCFLSTKFSDHDSGVCNAPIRLDIEYIEYYLENYKG